MAHAYNVCGAVEHTYNVCKGHEPLVCLPHMPLVCLALAFPGWAKAPKSVYHRIGISAIVLRPG